MRLWKHPFFLIWVNLAIIAAFKSYPAVGDIALQLSFLPFIFDEIKGNHYGFLVSVASVFSFVLAPIFWVMWIYHGTGNANFYYAINLVLTVAQVMFVIDCLSVVLKEEYMEKRKKKNRQYKLQTKPSD